MRALHFHVLGGAERHDVLAHCFIERHVRKIHSIQLRVTHDASSAFKMAVKDRFLWLPNSEDRSFREVTIKSSHLHIVDPGPVAALTMSIGLLMTLSCRMDLGRLAMRNTRYTKALALPLLETSCL